MFSYQHGFHAGGFADVHKHAALCLLIDHLARKETPFCVIDGFAGRGIYDLTSEQATKTGEWQAGIGSLYDAVPASAGLARYLETVRSFNVAGGLATYPGSPATALRLMRPADRLILVEAHPAEYGALRRAMRGDGRVHIHKRDGYEALPALVPPVERRGLVLIDPPYEIKTEYAAVPKIVAAVLRRWQGAIVAIWYPLLPFGRHAALLDGLAELARPLLVAELNTGAAPTEPGHGLLGTGLAVVNPPWTFGESMAEAGTEIANLLFGAAGICSLNLTGQPA